MPKVHHVKKARKDNPVVKKGESYYWWKFAYSPKRYSKIYPRASQLTQSDKLSRYYEAQETVDDLNVLAHVLDIAIELQEVADSVREIGEEYQESADNIRDYFTESETADECEEKSYQCDGTVDSIEEVIATLEDLDPDATDPEMVASIVGDISWEM
jgi:methyl-accepting chemotaxis protein